MKELALHLLDLAENSVSAQAQQVSLSVLEDPTRDDLRLVVADDGCGMDAATAARIVDPFYTSRSTRRVGLGLPLLKLAAEAAAGGLEVQSAVGQGTTITVWFQRSHIDRMPLGDLAGTWLSLLVGHPEVHWLFRYTAGEVAFELDDAALKHTLGEVPLTEPGVLEYIREWLEAGVAEVKAAARLATLRSVNNASR